MGKSTSGSLAVMKPSVMTFGILLLVPTTLGDSFRQTVEVGKRSCSCSFEFVLNGVEVNIRKSSVHCDKACSGVATDVELGGNGLNFYTVSFLVKRGKCKIRSASVELVSVATGSTTMPGSGSEVSNSSSSGIPVSCAQLKKMHHAVIHARLAFHCPLTSALGKETDCDKRVLQKLMNCQWEDDGYCFLQLITNEKACIVTGDLQPVTDGVCQTLQRMANFLKYARQAFCNTGHDTRGCSIWSEIGCTSVILSADAACGVVNAPDGEVLLVPCIAAVMGVGSSCTPCICDVIGC